MRRVIGAIGVGLLMLTSAIATPTQAAPTPPQYSITDIGMFAPGQHSYALAINTRGDVLGEVGNSNLVPFLYRNGHAARLTPPSNVQFIYASALNDQDIITAQGFLKNGKPVGYAIRPATKGFTWTQLPLPNLNIKDVSLAGVDQNGDIDGGITASLPKGKSETRSVLWKPAANGMYSAPTILAISPGFTVGLAGGSWFQRGVAYVAGAQGGAGVQEASLWSPKPSLGFLESQYPYASSLGGTVNHVFAVGPTWNNGRSNAWIAPVSFSKSGGASFGGITVLSTGTGYAQAEASGVTVDAHGKPVVVGELFDQYNTVAAIWRGSAPTLLQELVASSSPWTLTEAAGINPSRQIAGQGTEGSVAHALLLMPAKVSG